MLQILGEVFGNLTVWSNVGSDNNENALTFAYAPSNFKTFNNTTNKIFDSRS